MIWTSQHDRILKEGHETGKSAREIAEELTAAGYRCSRNSVLGRIFRKGWSDPSFERGKRKPRITLVPEGAGGPGCRWPFGDPGTPSFRFCCADIRTAGKPYCPEHGRLAYRARDEVQETVHAPKPQRPGTFALASGRVA